MKVTSGSPWRSQNFGAGRIDAAKSLLGAEADHPDSEMLLAAIEDGRFPHRPFARGSAWWLPDELTPPATGDE
jgi:hypothetical protein